MKTTIKSAKLTRRTKGFLAVFMVAAMVAGLIPVLDLSASAEVCPSCDGSGRRIVYVCPEHDESTSLSPGACTFGACEGSIEFLNENYNSCSDCERGGSSVEEEDGYFGPVGSECPGRNVSCRAELVATESSEDCATCEGIGHIGELLTDGTADCIGDCSDGSCTDNDDFRRGVVVDELEGEDKFTDEDELSSEDELSGIGFSPMSGGFMSFAPMSSGTTPAAFESLLGAKTVTVTTEDKSTYSQGSATVISLLSAVNSIAIDYDVLPTLTIEMEVTGTDNNGGAGFYPSIAETDMYIDVWGSSITGGGWKDNKKLVPNASENWTTDIFTRTIDLSEPQPLSGINHINLAVQVNAGTADAGKTCTLYINIISITLTGGTLSTPPSGTVAPIYDAGGQNWSGKLVNSGGSALSAEPSDIGGYTNTAVINSTSTNNYDYGLRVSLANLGITTSGKYSIAFIYYLPTTSQGTATVVQVCATDNGNFDNTGISNTGGTWNNIPAANTWNTITTTMDIDITDPDFNSSTLIRVQPNNAFIGPWYFRSIIVTRTGDLPSGNVDPNDCTHTWSQVGAPSNSHKCSLCGLEELCGDFYQGDNPDKHNCRTHGCWREFDHEFNSQGNCVCGAIQGIANCPSLTGGNHVLKNNEPQYPNHGCVFSSCSSWWENHTYNAQGICACGAVGLAPCPGQSGGRHTLKNNEPTYPNHGCTHPDCSSWWENHTYNAQGICACGAVGLAPCPGQSGGRHTLKNNEPTYPNHGCTHPDCSSWWENHTYVNFKCACGATHPCSNGHDIKPLNEHGHNCGRDCGGLDFENHTFVNFGCTACGYRHACASGHDIQPYNEYGHNCGRNCGALDFEAHSFVNNKCSVCDYVRVESVTVTLSDEIDVEDDTSELEPGEMLREADPIDTDHITSILETAISVGEIPVFILADIIAATGGSVLTSDMFLLIKELGVDVKVELPNGFSFTIIADSINSNIGDFDLSIDIFMTDSDTVISEQNFPAGSIVIQPNFTGNFGFDIKIHITADQLTAASINAENVNLFHIDHENKVTFIGTLNVNSDGSIDFTINHASYYKLSGVVPFSGFVDLATNERNVLVIALGIALGVVIVGGIVWIILVIRRNGRSTGSKT